MKLLNQSLKYLSISILAIITIWCIVFYVNMLNEIKSSVDEGLENHKRLIIQNIQKDSIIETNEDFDENFFTIQEIKDYKAISVKNQYLDTILFMQDADDDELEPEPVRMLITAFELNGKYYELKVANSMVEEDDLIEELLSDAIWLYISMIISILFINNLVLKKLWKPFYDFLNKLKIYRLGDTETLPQVETETKEFIDLQEAVNILLLHTTETYEQQKEFIGNASHELQTPLAITINKLELLIEKGRLETDQAEDISEVLQIIERLVKLNKSLLLLTKIENKQFLDNDTLCLNEIVYKITSDLDDISQFKEITISLNDKKDLVYKMDPSLARVMISNLLRNAVFHNIPNGNVSVEITKSFIKISNTGDCIELDKDLIFTRFYKPNSNSKSTGLGLAMVKAIADLYNFDLTYKFENKLHTFLIKIPKL